ncbi:hypothetical protein EON82_01040 [bacterium]|nr:MAG: hypothetical protein EON82_01040 [bacterium]
MALEHEPQRFTPDQRDEILNLAAHLQVRHQDTLDADELIQAAQEAGIDPRFVHEATMRLAQKSRPLPRSLLLALGTFVLQAGFFVFVQAPMIPGGRSVSSFELAFAVATAFFIALWAARERRVRWFAPLVALAVWFALFLATTAFTALQGVEQHWVLQDCVAFGFAQAAATLIGAIATAGIDRLDRAPVATVEAPTLRF